MAGRTVVSTEQKAKGGLSGFDGADVVQKSADFSGRLEFSMNPATVKPGDSYRLTVALVNDGKKAIKISGMTYSFTVNGNKTGNPVMPKVKEVGPASARRAGGAAGCAPGRRLELRRGSAGHRQQGRQPQEPADLEVGPAARSVLSER